MPLTTCPDCHRQISTTAPTCPQCGRAMGGTFSNNAMQTIRKGGKYELIGFVLMVIATPLVCGGLAPSLGMPLGIVGLCVFIVGRCV